MIEPTQVTCTERLPGPPLWRIGLVIGAFVAVLASAALTMGASPEPSASASPAPAATTSPSGDEFPGGFWGGPGMGGRHGFDGPGMGGRHGFGEITITAINGSNLSLKTTDGWTRTIAVTDSTTITRGGQAIGLVDLAVGDRIQFRQSGNDDGTFSITAIDVVVPHVAGTVTEVTGTGFALKDRDGLSWTITVSGSTAYSLGSSAGSRSDVKVGVEALVAGTEGSGNSLTATSVRVEPARVAGEVTAVSGDTITVKRQDATTATIKVGSGTTYQVSGVTDASLSDITVGMLVAAEGTQGSDGSLSATVVFGLPAGQPGWGHGRMHGWGHGRMHGWGWPGFPGDGAPSADPSGSSSGA
ncbi:MAG: hypothetical protein A2X23_13660 [Chloroflexi bacterium GWC2_73_18]|nr:MAG: hypothetical protein A2X23_13660 [Chloroflexi bacterium GWC2_73_18]